MAIKVDPHWCGELQNDDISGFNMTRYCLDHFNWAPVNSFFTTDSYFAKYCRPKDATECTSCLSPYLTGLRLFCDSWLQTLRVGRKAVLKQSPVIRNFLACVPKWRKIVAKILNMFKNFMRQNSSQNGRKVIADV